MVEDEMKFEQVARYEEQRLLARQSAAEFVGLCLTKVGQLGANDSEPGRLQDLLRRLEGGEIDPEEARSQAAAIVARKNSYH